MDKKDKNQKEERREQFAPHHDPKQQGDGDPGLKSASEEPEDQRGAKSPKPVQDQAAQD